MPPLLRSVHALEAGRSRHRWTAPTQPAPTTTVTHILRCTYKHDSKWIHHTHTQSLTHSLTHSLGTRRLSKTRPIILGPPVLRPSPICQKRKPKPKRGLRGPGAPLSYPPPRTPSPDTVPHQDVQALPAALGVHTFQGGGPSPGWPQDWQTQGLGVLHSLLHLSLIPWLGWCSIARWGVGRGQGVVLSTQLQWRRAPQTSLLNPNQSLAALPRGSTTPAPIARTQQRHV